MSKIGTFLQQTTEFQRPRRLNTLFRTVMVRISVYKISFVMYIKSKIHLKIFLI